MRYCCILYIFNIQNVCNLHGVTCRIVVYCVSSTTSSLRYACSKFGAFYIVSVKTELSVPIWICLTYLIIYLCSLNCRSNHAWEPKTTTNSKDHYLDSYLISPLDLSTSSASNATSGFSLSPRTGNIVKGLRS